MASLLGSDPVAGAAVAHALELAGAARTGYRGEIGFAGPDPGLVPFALAELCAIFMDKLDEAGGDSGAVMADIYLAIHGRNQGETEGAGHG
jgi:hypothetical protein